MLDRNLQLHILLKLADAYPDGVYELADAMRDITTDERALLVNSRYLDGHGLVKSGFATISALGVPNRFHDLHEHVITPKGLDFLADDGGLSAILGVVTVRFDAEQWREMLATKVESLTTATPQERSQVADALRKLPAQAVEKLSGKLLDWAVDHAQDALPLLHKWLNLAAG